ncbi:hypothetical protein AHAS_Ahas16G0226800 [Arachis hypogaea]
MMNGIQYWGESSSSTSLSSPQDVEDDRMIALVLSEEYAKLDGEVGRRLSSLAPVPHVPRINNFIPNISDASMDHQRLLQRLQIYGLCEVKVSGDGNCQFRALSDQLFRSPEHHKHVRKDIVKQLKGHRSLYECYVPMKYKKYCKKISKSGEWGDHLTLQAAADKFAAKICLLTSFRDTCFIEIMPLHQAPKRGTIVIIIVHLNNFNCCTTASTTKEETLVVLGEVDDEHFIVNISFLPAPSMLRDFNLPSIYIDFSLPDPCLEADALED